MAIVLVVAMLAPPQAADRDVMALVAGVMVGILAVGIAWPLYAVRRVRLSAVSPRDANVGARVPVTVTVERLAGWAEVRALDPASRWYRVSGRGTGVVQHRAERRGVFDVLRVEVQVSAPLGILSASRVLELRLPAPVEVAPYPLDVDWNPANAPIEGAVDAVSRPVAGGDLARAVRPYVSGDPSRLVHWPSTARTGTLVVREMEPPSPVGQAIVVDLRDLGPSVEQAASYAYGAALAVLGAGGQLVLCTAEAGGPVTEAVAHPVDAGRRLARAVVGEPGVAPRGWPIVEIGR